MPSDPTPPTIDAPERRAIACAISDPGATEGYKGTRTLTEWQTDAVMRILRANDEEAALWRAVEPWKDHNGPLPDYDSPLACVFDSGVQYAVELLAKELDVTDWTPCDGTEEYDGDLGGTLMNIVLAAMPTDADGEPIWPKDLPALLTASSGERGAWKTMESAPKDANLILLWSPDTHNYAVCGRFWHEEDAWEEEGDFTATLKPTHWMLLPEAPTPATVEEGS